MKERDCIGSVTSSGVRSLESHTAVEVGVRVRPVSASEKRRLIDKQLDICVDMNIKSHIVTVDTGANRFDFNFEATFWSVDDTRMFSDQSVVYDHFGSPLLENFLQGFNCTFIAYGQTGSGKTYSMLGFPDDPGIILRFCESLTNKLNQKQNEWILQISFYEIYNEKLRDLLALNSSDVQLKVRENPDTGPYVENLSCVPVRSLEDIMSWIDVGKKKRVTATTAVNEYSSRSHAIFVMKLSQQNEEDVDGVRHEYTRTSIINFVDLAGSERASYSTRLKETRMINKSLSCLSKVILQLSEKQSYISYRDSVLTWLLKESLGGNAKTFMLATVSPLKAHIEETLSTLRYASHARTIINRAHVNEDPAYTFIKKLKEEIARLHRLLEEGCDKTDESAIAQQHSEQNEQQLQNEESPGDEIVDLVKRMGSLRDTYEQKNRRSGFFRNSAIEDSQEPMLVLISPDVQLSPPLFFQLRIGRNNIGTFPRCEIVLSGSTINPLHCCIERFEDGRLQLVPKDQAHVCVNGKAVTTPTWLSPRDHIAIGRDQFLQYVCGDCTSSSSAADYGAEFHKAKFEYLAAENERLALDLSEAQKLLTDSAEKRYRKSVEELDAWFKGIREEYQQRYDRFDEQLMEGYKHNHPLKMIEKMCDDASQHLERIIDSVMQELVSEPEIELPNYVKEMNMLMKIFKVPFNFEFKQHSDEATDEQSLESGEQWTNLSPAIGVKGDVYLWKTNVAKPMQISSDAFMQSYFPLCEFFREGKRPEFNAHLERLFCTAEPIEKQGVSTLVSNITSSQPSNEQRSSEAETAEDVA